MGIESAQIQIQSYIARRLITDIQGCKSCAEHIFLLTLKVNLLFHRLLQGTCCHSARIWCKNITILRKVA